MIITENDPRLPDIRNQQVHTPPNVQVLLATSADALDGSTCHELVVIIRPSFKKLCEQDACRAALLNHLLYWIAQKAKGQETEKIKSGSVYWYGTAEEICAGLDHSWSVNKVRKEIKALVGSGLIGQRHNPVKGWDQTRHYFFGMEQGKVLKDACVQHGVDLLELGLPADMLHLLNLVNAFDKSGKCIQHICEMDSPNLVNASPKSGNAIPKDSTKVTTKDSPKRGNTINPEDPTHVAAHIPASSSNGVETSRIVSAKVVTQGQRISYSQDPEKQKPVPLPVAAPLASEETGSKAGDQRKQNNAAGKTSEKQKTSRSKSTAPSPGASLLLDAWDEINGRPLTRTREQVQAAEELARINTTGDDLKNVQERLLSQKDGFWKARGVSLKNVANNFHLAALGPLRPSDGNRTKASPPAQPAASSTQPAAVPGDKSQPRKLLRRIPSATQGELLPTGTSQEARAVQ